ncbi:hypothetical protein BZG36_01120 [Bifiguratus adelaidae]|uniref:Arsenate reductase (Glutaredoxin) n=1 Tax=Bifiguratus adelaidae TaxID=1938954 RepID=A0A261Y6B9_9FUNG|nr:hypothetical protein BZG36_01120 [Bifiguratus adelaidae]
MSFRDLRRLPIISIFHNPSCSKSRATLSLLQNVLNESSTAKPPFSLDIVDYTQNPPTKEQLQTVIDYLGLKDASAQNILRPDAPKVSSIAELVKLVTNDASVLERPIVVDWDAGKAVIARPPEKVEKLIQHRVQNA